MRRDVLFLGTIVLVAGCASAHGGATPADRAHVDAMAHQHAGETPTPNASVAPPRQPVSGADVTYGSENGRALVGYMAEPARASSRAPLPGVVMIHEWWGLNDNIRMMARRLAGEGYRVLAVDLYGGHAATTAAQAQGYMMQVMQDRPGAIENLRQAAGWLRGAQRAPSVGVIGWCFGGGWSLQSALQLPDRIDAAAVYYGQPVTDQAQLQRLRAPLIGFYGLRDQGIPADTVRRMEGELKRLGKNVEFHYYDASHAFANPSGASYNADAAEDAWRRTVEFFAGRLRRR